MYLSLSPRGPRDLGRLRCVSLVRTEPKPIRGMCAPYASEPIDGRPARPGTHELVALPRLPPRPRRLLLPRRRDLPPPVRPPRVPPQPPGELRLHRLRIPPPRLHGPLLPPDPRGPLRGGRLRGPRPGPLPDSRRPRPLEAAAPPRHPPPRRHPRVRRRGDPRGAVRPRPRGGDRREPRRGRRDGRLYSGVRPRPRGLPPLPLPHPPGRGGREAAEALVPEVARVRGGERPRVRPHRGVLPGPRGGEPGDRRVHRRPRPEDDPRPPPPRARVPRPPGLLSRLGPADGRRGAAARRGRVGAGPLPAAGPRTAAGPRPPTGRHPDPPAPPPAVPPEHDAAPPAPPRLNPPAQRRRAAPHGPGA